MHDQAKTELDPNVQTELFVAMNDLSVNDFVEIPVIHRATVACASNGLNGYVGTTWASDVYDIKNWRMVG